MPNCLNPICNGGVGKFAPSLSYFSIASKLKKLFALMHPEFELNLITNIFRKFETAGQPEVTSFLLLLKAPKEFYAILSTMHAYQTSYSIHCTAYSLSMLIFCCNKLFYLLINALHHHSVIDDVIIQKYCFFCCFSK